MAQQPPRNNNHRISEKAIAYVHMTVAFASGKVDASFRLITGLDYGVDAHIEIYKNSHPTGDIAYVQIKGTEAEIKPLKTKPTVVSCSISKSNLYYASQTKTPLILLYAKITEPMTYYYLILQNVPEIVQRNMKSNSKSVTFHLPVANIVKHDASSLLEAIANYYQNLPE